MNTHTHTSKMKSKKNKKNKSSSNKLLKKIVKSSIYDDNIIILFGGSAPVEHVSMIDKILGHKEEPPVESSSIVTKAQDYFENFSKLVEVLIARKVLSIAGLGEIPPDQVAEMVKHDTEAMRKINEYLKTNDGRQALDEIQELSNTAVGVVGESIEALPEKLDESINGLANNTVNAFVDEVSMIPGPGTIVNGLKLADDVIGATGKVTEAVGEVSDLVGETADKLGTHVSHVSNKVDELAGKASKMKNNFTSKMKNKLRNKLVKINKKLENEEEEPQPPVVEEESPPIVEEEQPIVEEESPPVVEEEQPIVEEEQPIVEEEQPPIVEEESPNESETTQYGGADVKKMYGSIQKGGKKIKNRVDTTRRKFLNLAKKITRKNK